MANGGTPVASVERRVRLAAILIVCAWSFYCLPLCGFIRLPLLHSF